jgi:hypothetical protein
MKTLLVIAISLLSAPAFADQLVSRDLPLEEGQMLWEQVRVFEVVGGGEKTDLLRMFETLIAKTFNTALFTVACERTTGDKPYCQCLFDSLPSTFTWCLGSKEPTGESYECASGRYIKRPWLLLAASSEFDAKYRGPVLNAEEDLEEKRLALYDKAAEAVSNCSTADQSAANDQG